MQLALFSWIMLKTFSKKPALAYFLDVSQGNVEMLFHYNLKQAPQLNDFRKVFVPTDANCQYHDKLLNVISNLNAKLGLDLFIKIETHLGPEEIAFNAKTSLPSIYLSGNYIHTSF